MSRRWFVAGAALLAVGVCVRAGLVPAALPELLLAFGLWTATAVDLGARRIPNALVLALALAGSGLHLVGLAHGWRGDLWAALAAGAWFALLAWVSRGGFGWGDAKLAAVMGWFLGPRGIVIALVGTAVFGGLAATAVLVRRRGGWRATLPYAPALLAGGLLALAWPRP